MEKIIVVCGPTATGKSDYAVELAKNPPAGGGYEIISADSRQVYRGLTIGSGKITKKEMKGVPHHLIDIANPKRTFSVAQYQTLADKAIKTIFKKGKTPIITGGTGFYIDAVIFDQHFPKVKPNKTLRKQLSSKSAPELFAYLQTLDPDRAREIDRHNTVRLIRAIEIATLLGTVPKIERKQKYLIEWHYLDFPDEVLKKRIHDRLLKRMKTGMVKEVQNLHTHGLSWKRLESLGLEYRYVALYLQNLPALTTGREQAGKRTKQEMLTQLEMAIWHYAKRQRTWFKKYAK